MKRRLLSLLSKRETLQTRVGKYRHRLRKYRERLQRTEMLIWMHHLPYELKQKDMVICRRNSEYGRVIKEYLGHLPQLHLTIRRAEGHIETYMCRREWYYSWQRPITIDGLAIETDHPLRKELEEAIEETPPSNCNSDVPLFLISLASASS